MEDGESGSRLKGDLAKPKAESKLRGKLHTPKPVATRTEGLLRLKGTLIDKLKKPVDDLTDVDTIEGSTSEAMNSSIRGASVAQEAREKVTRFNHPEVFDDPKKITLDENENRYTYNVDGIGFISLLKQDYDDNKVLQVDVVELDENHRNQGYGSDFYRYVLEHLPTGYMGILSGTITDERIHSIYKRLVVDYSVQNFGRRGYLVTPKHNLGKK